MDPLRRQYLEALGIERWVLRTAVPDAPAAPAAPAVPQASPQVTAPAPVSRTAPSPRAPTAPAAGGEAALEGLDWERLRARVAACVRCGLSATRTQTVFGVGNRQAEWLVVGEAPGAEEDRQGEPFVGRAGQLLNAMLRAIGLERTQVYIANILKCRPPHNRDPSAEEARQCMPFLERQIALLQPKVMLAVGRIAAQNLLGTDAPLARMRGQVYTFGLSRVPLIVTYHPAYLLRTPADKRKAWEDLKFAREVCARVQR
jgi:DNA polymerase